MCDHNQTDASLEPGRQHGLPFNSGVHPIQVSRAEAKNIYVFQPGLETLQISIPITDERWTYIRVQCDDTFSAFASH